MKILENVHIKECGKLEIEEEKGHDTYRKPNVQW